MFSFFKKKKTVAHIKLNGVIGNAGKFKQGIDFAGQEERYTVFRSSVRAHVIFSYVCRTYPKSSCYPAAGLRSPCFPAAGLQGSRANAAGQQGSRVAR